MKKLFLFVGLLTACAAHAALYTSSDDGYAYTGTPVDSFRVDFTTWVADSLPASWLDADAAHEAGGMAFVKWTLTNRSVKIDGVSSTMPTAFNNGTSADPTPVKNNVTSNKPRIYLPTTTRGVKAIHARIACANARSLAVNYKDDNHSAWTYTSAQVLSAPGSWNVAEVSCELNTVGETSIFLQYGSTDYFTILSLELELVGNQSVSLDMHSLLLNTDAQRSLTATPIPADLPLSWSSTDETVCTVADGVVTAVGQGTADIIVSAGDAAADTCHVTTVAHNNYAVGEDGYWHYTGEPVNELDVEFSNLSEENSYYTTGNIHADLLWNFAGVGLYKWGYLQSRSCAGEEYGPMLWNSGNSENGTNFAIKDSNPDKLPAIYLPEIANGIKTLTVEGWTNNNGRSLMIDVENEEGNWQNITAFNPGYESYYITLDGNSYSTATFNVSDRNITRMRLYRNSNDYQFITRITVEPMPEVTDPTAVEQLTADKHGAEKLMRNGQLVILRGENTYNAIGQTVK